MSFSEIQFDSAARVHVQSFGDCNLDKVFYVIRRKGRGAGFFSNVFHVLGHLRLAERLGLTPVVDMRNFCTLYNEEEPVHGTQNAWEYYFEQPGRVSLNEVYESRHVLFCDGEFPFDIYEDVAEEHALFQRYIRPHPWVLAQAEEFFRCRLSSGKVLGIHFRGQEMNKVFGHPTGPKPEQMVERVRYLLSIYPIEHIFLVTEEQGYVDLFVREFGPKVLFTDAFRTYDINAYHIRPYPRELHMYRLGLDVLVDTLILSKADYLLASGKDGIASGSNVSQAAQALNGGCYEHVELVYNGINTPTRKDLLRQYAHRKMGKIRRAADTVKKMMFPVR